MSATTPSPSEEICKINENLHLGVQEVGAIDMTPTWGEVGLLFWRLALSGEIAAVEQMRSEIAKAFAGMEVLSRLMNTLTPEQRAVFDEVWQAEQAKMLR